MFFKIKQKKSKFEEENSNSPLTGIISQMQIRFKKLNNRDNFLHHEIIGKDATFFGPFGERKCIYFDTTASGKPLKIVEDFITTNVLPYYANTHTSVSYTSFVMSSYRDEARKIARDIVGASEEDVLLFCGNGTTTAIHKLVHILDIQKDKLPVIFVGPFEHHSNLLPWRETGSEVINVPVDSLGGMDLKFLELRLHILVSQGENRGRPIYGCFSAGSNVTGLLTDDVKVTKLLHKYGGLCFWDYASTAPHATIRMNPGSIYDQTANKDALYFSGHKFLGGPQTPGVLVVKRHVFQNTVPHNAGGGTIFFVTPERHAYLTNIEEAQEGGTPAIVESIRLGALLTLRKMLGIGSIVQCEADYTRKALNSWRDVPGLIILGNSFATRLPIISFVIEHEESGYYLHQNFVVALLNDIFGIQCRGGCMCAGPYAQILLDISIETAGKYEAALSHDCSSPSRDLNHNVVTNDPVYYMIYRPGFTRISLPAEATQKEVDLLIEGVKLIAKYGWKMLAHYSVCPETGNFRLNSQIGSGFWKNRPQTVADVLSIATKIFHSVEKNSVPSQKETKLPKLLEHLRWFMLPSDAQLYLRSDSRKPRSSRPFIVKKFQKDDSKPFGEMFTFSKLSIPCEIQKANMPQDIMKGYKKIAPSNGLSTEHCKLLSFSCSNIYSEVKT